MTPQIRFTNTLSAAIRLLLALAFLAVPVRAAENPPAGQYIFYVGTYTRGGQSKGIYAYRMDTATGALTPIATPVFSADPSFLEIDPKGRFLYAVNELNSFQGKPAGAVSAFSINAQSGQLTPINQRSALGTITAHLAVDRDSKHLVIVNYGNGSNSVVFPIESDGSLGDPTSMVHYTGRSIGSRQAGPHTHSVVLDAANRFALECDLGLDKVLIYRYDAEKGTLTPNEPAFATVKAGSGARHIAFDPSGTHAYVISEMGSLMTVFAYDSQQGALKELQSISTIPADFKGNNSAEVAVHPNGNFVYGSNRGHDSIAVFAIDHATGTLTLVEYQSTQGKGPRNFAIDPTGRYLLAANQNSNNIVVFTIDAKTGRLTPTGQVADVPSPVCIKFLAPSHE